ncbi:unnamed protein product [Miscanthus lutarioriparius]|uniref:Uncharacterized protein n=1 Tax=Miscanthus lutarioriparius TaxID=422564 RepID=A0A811QYD5_9POAL|nr:unnamed protein product [Miscanthus lutarioriparius]
MLKNDLKARVNWGSSQQPVVHEFDMSGGERKLLNDTDLFRAFSERMGDSKLFLFVDVEDKPTEVVTEVAASNVGHDNVIGPIDSSKEAFVSHTIDWDSMEFIPLGQDQIGAALPVMDEDAMYEFVGLRAEDERAEQSRMAATINLDDMDLQDTDMLVHDRVPVHVLNHSIFLLYSVKLEKEQ